MGNWGQEIPLYGRFWVFFGRSSFPLNPSTGNMLWMFPWVIHAWSAWQGSPLCVRRAFWVDNVFCKHKMSQYNLQKKVKIKLSYYSLTNSISDTDSRCNERFSISCCTSIVSKIFLFHFRYEIQRVLALLQLDPIPLPGNDRLWISTDWTTKFEFIPTNSHIIWQVWARLVGYRHV